jgi:hypothetical protein
MDAYERLNIIALRSEVVFNRPHLGRLLGKINSPGQILGLHTSIDPLKVTLEQIFEIENAVEKLLNGTTDKTIFIYPAIDL